MIVKKRCLIVKLGAIGDVVMAIAAVRQLYEAGYEIDWVCGTAVEPLLCCYSWLNPIVVDERSLFRGRPASRAKAIAQLWRVLVGARYDLCATLYYDMRYALLSLPVRSERRLMLSRTERAARLLPGRHHTDEYARILLGKADSVEPVSITPVRPDRLPVSPLPTKSTQVRVAVVPGGANNLIRQQLLRRWPIESYVSLVQILLSRGWEVVLLGGPDDVWVRTHFEGLSVIDCIGQFDLAEVIAVCDRCDVVISHDTGPMHLAGLSEAALIGLFGPTDAACFLPRRHRVIGLRGGEGFACRPCYDGRDFAPCSNNLCLQQISVEDVLAAVDKLMD